MIQVARIAVLSIAVVALCASMVAPVPVLAGTGTGSAQGTTTTPAWLQRLNSVRIAAGVATVSEDSALTTGIQHHLTYLEKTDPSLRTGQYASAHTENPLSPYYTDDGALEGSRSNLVRNASQTDVSAVDYWFAAPFHAIGMLRAGLTRTAFAQDATYAGMDIIAGLSTAVRSATPILFPGPGSTSYLTSYAGNESPDPVETCRKTKSGADYSAPGLPIIAMLPAAPATGLVATLTTPTGTALSSKGAELCVVDENTYVSTDSVYGPTGQQVLSGDRAVLLVPRTQLLTGTYAVRISQPKQSDIAWSFTVDPTARPTSPPVTLAPRVSLSGVTCSYGARATGAVSVAVANPDDGVGTATYSLTIGSRTAVTGGTADGRTATETLTRLPAGLARGTVSGSDGTSAVFDLDVPVCPRFTGVRVHLRAVAAHRVRIILDNTRNAVATRFRIHIGSDTSRHRVAAMASDRTSARLHGVTRVRVYVGDHLVARARMSP